MCAYILWFSVSYFVYIKLSCCLFNSRFFFLIKQSHDQSHKGRDHGAIFFSDLMYLGLYYAMYFSFKSFWYFLKKYVGYIFFILITVWYLRWSHCLTFLLHYYLFDYFFICTCVGMIDVFLWFVVLLRLRLVRWSMVFQP